MRQIVCLIAAPAGAPLEDAIAGELARALHARPHWLAAHQAVEFALDGGEPGALAARVRALLGPRPIDVAIVPAHARRKRLLVSDMDSTIITVECIDELADLVGVKREVAEITRRAMNGELDFEAALSQRVALLEGLPESVFAEVYRDRVRLMPGARTLVATMRARGAFTALVSGGFVPFVERVKAEVGFDLAQANRLEVQGGHLTGRVVPPVLGADAKLALLRRLRERLGLAREETLAVGDGANDLAMLAEAGLGVAFRAHERVAKAARIAISHGDLTALLYLQGIAKADFVT